MQIKTYQTLPESVVTSIREVEAICKSYDSLQGSLFLDASLNFNSTLNSTFLLYDGETLISILSVFAPSFNEAEITGYTLPDYRQKGYFSRLLKEAIQELSIYHIHEIVLVCEGNAISGKQAIQKWKATYDYTEYLMTYASGPAIEIYSFQTTLHTPALADVPQLADMSHTIFGDSYEDAKSMIENTINSSNRRQKVLVSDGQWVGLGAVCLQTEDASINGVGILPTQQGKGLGKQLLGWLVKELQEEGYSRITIEVNSQNDKAFTLYKQAGFEVEMAYEYYRLKL